MSTQQTERPLFERGATFESRPRRRQVVGWGGVSPASVSEWAPDGIEQLSARLDGNELGGAIPRGLGRAYGDAAQLSGGTVIATGSLRRLELEPDAGILTVGAGVSLREVLLACVARGWILPVVPGTQYVSVGGAIASDIHGKNHGAVGTFGAHVRALGLLTADGEVRELLPGQPGREFEATLGGMGLTGVIVWARIALRRVRSAMLAVDTDRADTLEEIFELLRVPGGEHRVAWVDLLAHGGPRGVVTRAAHLDVGELSGRRAVPAARATVPAGWPGGLLRPETIRAFNELRFRRAPRHERERPEGFGAHMFPLDGLHAWPRLYGHAGFVQYQFVVPFDQQATIERVLDELRRGGVPCYLAVLKDFGAAGAGILSFPIEGWTLALDLPHAAPGLRGALDRCDELVAAAGGRVYFSKDVRMNARATRAMYERLDEWREVRDRLDPDGIWRSDLALRTGLVEAR